MLPDFVIIGAQKSGSTALMRHLGDHPEVYLPVHETRYLRDPWFQFEPRSVLEDAVATTKPGVLRRGIKCPDLLSEEPAAQRIKDVLGDVPLIAVLREPVQRAISAYFWGMQWGWVPLAEPNVGLMRILNGEYDVDYPRAREVLIYGLYGEHVERYHHVFGAGRLLVMTDESLRSDTDASLRMAFHHLGVREDVPLANRERSVNAGVYSMKRLNVLRHRHKYILRAYPGYERYGKYVQPAAGFPDRIINRSLSIWDRWMLARLIPNERPPILSRTTRSLAEFYEEDLEKLGSLLGRDFSRWYLKYGEA